MQTAYSLPRQTRHVPAKTSAAVQPEPRSTALQLSPLLVLRIAALVIAVFASIQIFLIINQFWLRADNVVTRMLAYFFDVNTEKAVPTYFSFLLLFAAAVLLFFIWHMQRTEAKGNRIAWLALALGFFFLSFDEVLMFHETYGRTAGTYLLRKTNFSDSYLVWTLPYAVAGLLTGIIFLRFVCSLPARTKMLFFVAGFLYVGGAVGMEILGGWMVELQNGFNLAYRICECLEEVMEMSGVALFVFALLDYITRQRWKVVLVPAAANPTLRQVQ